MQHKLLLPEPLFDSSKVYEDGDKVVISGNEYEVKVVDKNRDGDTYELIEVVKKPVKAVKIAF
ncbi:hypothetical protein [Idiomarina baltica]|uniref:Uncharacterized protein n=1 Tax=Idiomarina baltica OS145 TaxID=314276 RepID=A0ABP2CU01_9GAMM|nr:hypothetical protein [Idiomarina baltica]EAQ33280.1 hypothetical protein OS145_02890 [Idiomarina baltica OS145]